MRRERNLENTAENIRNFLTLRSGTRNISSAQKLKSYGETSLKGGENGIPSEARKFKLIGVRETVKKSRHIILVPM